MSDIQELKDIIRKLHDAEAIYIRSVPVKETRQGKTIWREIVEVFDLRGHPKAGRVYAWTNETDSPDRPRCVVTVLHIDPVLSPEAAVRAALVQECKSLATGS